MEKQGRTHIDLQHLLGLRHYLHKFELLNTSLEPSTLLGLHRSRLRGRGMDFDQVRAYQTGDDARSIDWRVTARTGKVHTKIFHEERERPTFILIEQSLHLFFASTGCFKSVLAAQAASLFAWASLQNNDRVGGVVFDQDNIQHVPIQRNRHSVLHFLRAIADANQRLQQPATAALNNPLPQALQHAQHLSRPGSLIILICNERHLNESTRLQLCHLAKHAELVLLPLSDPLEHALPDLALARFRLGGNTLSIDSQNANIRQQWQQTGAVYQTAWQDLAQQTNAFLLPLSTCTPLLEQLQAVNLQARSTKDSL